jgi:hypothetical protein
MVLFLFICKFGQNLAADKICGRALGSLLGRGRIGGGKWTSYCPKGTIWDTIWPLALEMLWCRCQRRGIPWGEGQPSCGKFSFAASLVTWSPNNCLTTCRFVTIRHHESPAATSSMWALPSYGHLGRRGRSLKGGWGSWKLGFRLWCRSRGMMRGADKAFTTHKLLNYTHYHVHHT